MTNRRASTHGLTVQTPFVIAAGLGIAPSACPRSVCYLFFAHSCGSITACFFLCRAHVVAVCPGRVSYNAPTPPEPECPRR